MVELVYTPPSSAGGLRFLRILASTAIQCFMILTGPRAAGRRQLPDGDCAITEKLMRNKRRTLHSHMHTDIPGKGISFFCFKPVVVIHLPAD